MPETEKRTIKIFIKNPQKGRVKTRLAASVGDEQALLIYKELLNYTRKIVTHSSAAKEVWYSEFVDLEDNWNARVFKKKLQEGIDLGARMKNAFRDSYKNKKPESVVLIGSDCAELTEGIISRAFESLRGSDLVFGPAKDGGYYLVGMSKYIPEIFDEIAWSTERVLNQTLLKVKLLNHSFVLLPELNDVDTIEDWEKVKSTMIQ